MVKKDTKIINEDIEKGKERIKNIAAAGGGWLGVRKLRRPLISHFNKGLQKAKEESLKTSGELTHEQIKQLAGLMGAKKGETPVILRSPRTSGVSIAKIPKSLRKKLDRLDGWDTFYQGFLSNIKNKKQMNQQYREMARRGAVAADKFSGPIIAHELGHSRQLLQRRGTWPALMGSLIAKNLYKAGPVAGLAYAAFGDEDRAKYAPAIPLVAGAPVLATEAGASIRGYRGLKRFGYTPKQLKLTKKLLTKAGLTYLTTPVLGAAAALGVSAIRGARKKHRESLKKEAKFDSQFTQLVQRMAKRNKGMTNIFGKQTLGKHKDLGINVINSNWAGFGR